MMFGYASSETPVLMPAPITWAHALTRTLARYRKDGTANWLRPDSKSQVSVRYLDGRPVEITRVVVSTQHSPDVSAAQIRELIIEKLIPEAITGAVLGEMSMFDGEPRNAILEVRAGTGGDEAVLGDAWADLVLVNPSGSFVEGGPATDTGVTGRKIIVDTYGGAARHGGGAFSGKDPSKVDRSAAYATRWAAKNVVAAGLATRCEICIAYAIGVAEPVAIGVETFGTGDERAISAWIRDNFDLTPSGIIDGLDLTRPIYTPTSAYGHFGRSGEGDGLFPWENVVRKSAAIEVPA